MDEFSRPEPPHLGHERETLIGFLDFLRATLATKASGLDGDGLRRRLEAHPSDMSLGGLLKHLAYVEDYWCTEVVDGGAAPEPWASVDWSGDPDWDWHSADEDAPEAVWALWRAAVDRSRQVLTRHDALDGRHARPGSGEEVSLRWLLTHLVEEYARHCGHADLLREAIDGSTGE